MRSWWRISDASGVFAGQLGALPNITPKSKDYSDQEAVPVVRKSPCVQMAEPKTGLGLYRAEPLVYLHILTKLDGNFGCRRKQV
jgi:hypothetical protein